MGSQKLVLIGCRWQATHRALKMASDSRSLESSKSHKPAVLPPQSVHPWGHHGYHQDDRVMRPCCSILSLHVRAPPVSVVRNSHGILIRHSRPSWCRLQQGWEQAQGELTLRGAFTLGEALLRPILMRSRELWHLEVPFKYSAGAGEMLGG